MVKEADDIIGEEENMEEEEEEENVEEDTQRPKRKRWTSSPNLSLNKSCEEQCVISSDEIIEDDKIEEVLFVLKEIKNATHREEKSKLVFTRSNQQTVGRSIDSIHQNMLRIYRKISKLEKTNLILKSELDIARSNRKLQQAARTKINQVKQPTYADAASVKTFGTMPTMPKKQETTWTTPPRPLSDRSNDILIATTDGTDIKEPWKEIGRKVKPKDINGALVNVIKLGTNKILLKTQNDEQKHEMSNLILTQPNLQVNESNLLFPTIQICGLEGDMEENEFFEALTTQNEEVIAAYGHEDIKKNITILSRRKCRNPDKENWLIRVTPNLAKFMLKEGRITINLTSLYVQEHVNIPICFKCCLFGHVQKFCKSKEETCHKCGKKHDSRGCDNALNCVNCQKMGIQQRKHSARDKECPCFKRKEEQKKKNIDYGSN